MNQNISQFKLKLGFCGVNSSYAQPLSCSFLFSRYIYKKLELMEYKWNSTLPKWLPVTVYRSSGFDGSVILDRFGVHNCKTAPFCLVVFGI